MMFSSLTATRFVSVGGRWTVVGTHSQVKSLEKGCSGNRVEPEFAQCGLENGENTIGL